MRSPGRAQAARPEIDLTGGGRYPVLGASHHVEAATARHDRVAWALRGGRVAARRRHLPAHARDRTASRRRPGRRRGDACRPDRGGRRAVRRRRPGHRAGGAGRRPAPDPDPPAARVRDQRLRARVSARSSPARSSSCYVSQTERGQMLIGAEFDAQPSYSRQSSFARCAATPARSPGCCRSCATCGSCGQWAGICDISADYSPIMGSTPSTASSSRPAGGRGASRPSRPAARAWPS